MTLGTPSGPARRAGDLEPGPGLRLTVASTPLERPTRLWQEPVGGATDRAGRATVHAVATCMRRASRG